MVGPFCVTRKRGHNCCSLAYLRQEEGPCNTQQHYTAHSQELRGHWVCTHHSSGRKRNPIMHSSPMQSMARNREAIGPTWTKILPYDSPLWFHTIWTNDLHFYATYKPLLSFKQWLHAPTCHYSSQPAMHRPSMVAPGLSHDDITTNICSWGGTLSWP
jgi:hypothetical protein